MNPKGVAGPISTREEMEFIMINRSLTEPITSLSQYTGLKWEGSQTPMSY